MEVIRRIHLLAVLLTVAGCAAMGPIAAETLPTCITERPAEVVRVGLVRGYDIVWSTGTVVRDDGTRAIVLTSDELMHSEDPGTICVRPGESAAVTGRVLEHDAEDGLLAIGIPSIKSGQVHLAAKIPTSGAEVLAGGFDRAGQFRLCPTRVGGATNRWLSIGGGVVPGHAGGPVFDRSGGLCGILYRGDARCRSCVPLPRIRAFLDRLFGPGRPHIFPMPANVGGSPAPNRANPGASGQDLSVSVQNLSGSVQNPGLFDPGWHPGQEQAETPTEEFPPLDVQLPLPDPDAPASNADNQAGDGEEALAGAAAGPSPARSWAETLGPAIATAMPYLLGAAGVAAGGPVGAAGAWGLWKLLAAIGAGAIRRRRSKKSDPSRVTRPAEPIDQSKIGGGSISVTADAPQQIRHWIETQFVNVESDVYQRAHELARQNIARRFPGSQEILEAELSLTRQYAAGLKKE